MSRGAIITVCFAALLLVFAAVSSRIAVDRVEVERYHASVREAAQRFPINMGEWAGHEVDLPPSATKLLRPNAIIAREYQSTVREGLSATVLLVQCADIRDMQGHYPPNCYPAHGWSGTTKSRVAQLGDLPAARYDFVRRSERGERGITVYNLFILPTGETTIDMRDVRRASSDYGTRPFGAAQVQVVIDKDVPESEHAWILGEMRRIADPVVEVLRAGTPALREGASR